MPISGLIGASWVAIFSGAMLFISVPSAYANDPDPSKSFEDYPSMIMLAQANTDVVKLGAKTARRKGCAACHSLDGTRRPGPTWKGLYGSQRKLVTGQVVEADDEYIRKAILKPRSEVVKGWPRSLMPKDLRRKLSDKQIEAIIELIKSVR